MSQTLVTTSWYTYKPNTLPIPLVGWHLVFYHDDIDNRDELAFGYYCTITNDWDISFEGYRRTGTVLKYTSIDSIESALKEDDFRR